MSSEQDGQERAPKRQRTENDFAFDKNFHFTDGNIILVTEGTAFKVHKGVLSRHSIFFRDMFTLANESSTESESHEGCQVLQLSDSKQDVVFLMQAFYDNKVTSPDDFDELSRLLRISNKYLAHKLFKRTVETLEKSIPITYEDYKAVLNTGREFANLNVATAAITTGADIFLPILYYEFSKIINARKLNALPSNVLADILTYVHFGLSFLPGVLKRIQEKNVALDTCRFPRCWSAWKEFTTYFEQAISIPKQLLNPMYHLLHTAGGGQYVLPGECQLCRAARINFLDAQAKNFWSHLPRLFNVAKSWDELQAKHKKLKELDNEDSQQ